MNDRFDRTKSILAFVVCLGLGILSIECGGMSREARQLLQRSAEREAQELKREQQERSWEEQLRKSYIAEQRAGERNREMGKDNMFLREA
jgi:hypothetical protein